LGFSFNISATAEDSDFKFGMQLEFATSHRKISPRRKVVMALSYKSSPSPIIKSHRKTKVSVALVWELQKNLGFPFNIYAMAETSDFNFGTQLGFAN